MYKQKEPEKVGHKFGDWTVISDVVKRLNKYNQPHLLCQCKCGTEKMVNRANLRAKRTNKCRSCSSREMNTRHGLSKDPLHYVWWSIIERTENPNNPSYINYGGRGIAICKDWRDQFESFYYWCMKNGYKRGLEIDRIDNCKGYGPSNCRFVTREVNQQNKRNNHLLTAFGETKCASEWSKDERCMVNDKTMRRRSRVLRWTDEDCITKKNMKPRRLK